MKSFMIAVAVSVAAIAFAGHNSASAQGSTARVLPVSPKHIVPRTNNTGGFIFGFAPNSSAERHKRGHRGRERFGIGDYGYGYSDGDGYVDTIPMSTEPGFFANGGSVSFDGAKPVYDYDRSYPYEYYAGRPTASRTVASSSSHCELRNVPDESSRRTVTVRVCRRG